MNLTFRELRHRAGHTQTQAAAYIWCSKRTIDRIEAGYNDKARTTLYRLKLQEEGLI